MRHAPASPPSHPLRSGIGLCLLVAGLVATAMSVAYAAPPHVHGEAQLEIVQEGNTLSIHLESPAESLLGFEHPPRSPAETQAVAKLKATLGQSDTLFTLTESARCRALPVRLTSPLWSGPAAGHHADVDADFGWQCAEMPRLRDFRTSLLSLFPRLQRLKVTFVGQDGQKSAVLTPGQARFAW